ncbi:MAG: SDR family NAD(P)-dependent oxidoreductase [Pseudomonadota bacterium]|nr:SDR family NAD(P)-dependent oxidoreductase [Pseudomonadota bacterium]
MKAVVITGVSTGIGYATSALMAKQGFHVFGSVRKLADADALKTHLGNQFTPLVFDVTDEAAVHAAAAQVRASLKGARLAGLVNNAGIAVGGPLTHVPIGDFRKQMEVNITGPMIVTQAFLPLLGTDDSLSGVPGRIVNITSVAGKMGAPFVGPYVASKHALEGLSESLRRELMFYGIDVVMVAPGHVATPIWDKAEQVDPEPYKHLAIFPAMQKFLDFFVAEGRKGFPPERIAGVVLEALTAASPKTRYPVVPGHIKNWTIPRLLPTRVVDKVLASQLGLKRK